MLEKIRASKEFACNMFWEKILSLVENWDFSEEQEHCVKMIYMEDIIEKKETLNIISEANKYLKKIDKDIYLAKSVSAGEVINYSKLDFTRTDLCYKVNLIDYGIEITNIKGPENALKVIANRLKNNFESEYVIKDGVLTVWVKL